MNQANSRHDGGAIRSLAPMTVIDIKCLTDKADGDWLNFPLSENNDHVVRVSVMDCDFYWRTHQNIDETFLVLEGGLMLDLEDKSFSLLSGQMPTMPKGLRHRTRAKDRNINLTFDHRDTNVVGD